MYLNILKLSVFVWYCGQVYAKVENTSVHSKDDNFDEPVRVGNLIPKNYDKMKPPRDGDNPVTVDIKVSVLTMRNVDEKELSYDMDIFFHQFWKDTRLTLPDKYQKEGKVVLDNKWTKDIWTPDTYFKNSRDGKLHDIIIPYTYFILYNDSTVFLASRLGLKLNCMMDMRNYPHDQQECEISIMSLQHTNDVVDLQWKSFELTKHILLPQFDVVGNSSGTCTRKYDIGTFSCIVGKVQLSRRLGYFLLNRYVPSILVVFMSCLSFWVPASAHPARISLSVTSTLTIVTLQYTINMPSVSYIMAINVWIIGCIAFVFLTLIEYTIIIGIQTCCKVGDRDSKKGIRVEKLVLNIDRVSRFLFPAAFGLFCAIYFMSYV